MNEAGTVIYVGKAKDLRSRLRSYVSAKVDKSIGPWKLKMREQIADFDLTVTNTELEALLLETNMIKELRPKYNVMMKDDKNYVYVEVSVQEEYPRVEVVRKVSDRAAKYFGPYLSAYETRMILELLEEVVHFRACSQSIDRKNKMQDPRNKQETSNKKQATSNDHACLEFQIGKCNGLCAGAITREEYRSRIDRVITFFKGDHHYIIDAANNLMRKSAEERKFEKASALRDALKLLEGMDEKQIVSDTSGDDADIIGVACLSNKVQVVVFRKRGGKVLKEHAFALAGQAEGIASVLEQFLPQYYDGILDVPSLVIVAEDFPGREAMVAYLTMKRERKVSISVPERGNKSKLLELAEKNAEQKALQAEASWEAESRNVENALAELAGTLDLPAPPQRVEGYDISHTGGTETVGSMVVLISGKPRNAEYRSFTIHSMQRGAVDDYRALKEVLARRLRHIAGGLKAEEKRWKDAGITLDRIKKDDRGSLLVARHEGEEIGSVRLDRSDGKLELAALTIDPAYEQTALGYFLARSILRTVKKGKVYARVEPELEQQYASIGFRHLVKAPHLMLYDTSQHKPDSSLAAIPDLLVIDGGKGQLSAVGAVLTEFKLSIPVIGLAKREEEVFVPGHSDPILFPQDSAAKFLLMRLRDEAHRFANRHRKGRAASRAVESQLDRIPGIGPDTRTLLLKKFGSVDIIKRMPDERLKEILNDEQINILRQIL